MIGGKLHTVSKLQVRLKRRRDGTVLNTETVWADMAYYECSIGGVEEEASGPSTSTSTTVNRRPRNVLDIPHLIVGEDALDALSGPQLTESCSRFHGKPKACCESKCFYSKSKRCMTEEEFDPLKLGENECDTIDPSSVITGETPDEGGLFTKGENVAFPVNEPTIMSNGYVKSKGTVVKTLDDGIIDALEGIRLDTSPRPTRAQIESKEPPSGLGQHDVAIFEIDKEYLLLQDFEPDNGPIRQADVHDRHTENNMIFNCIDHSGLKANSFNAMETCERANGPGIPVERIGIGRNRPPLFPSDSDLSDGESTPRRRDVDVFHLAPCEAFLSAKETVDKFPSEVTEADAQYEGTSLFSLLSLSLSLSDNPTTTTNHTKTAAKRSQRVAAYACVQEICRCDESTKRVPEGLRNPLSPLPGDRLPGSPPLSYCYVSDTQITVTEDTRKSFDEGMWGNAPTDKLPKLTCVEILHSIMTPEITNPYFVKDETQKKWVRKCSHSAEDVRDEQFTGAFAFFKNVGRYMRRNIFGKEDRHCAPL